MRQRRTQEERRAMYRESFHRAVEGESLGNYTQIFTGFMAMGEDGPSSYLTTAYVFHVSQTDEDDVPSESTSSQAVSYA